MQLADAVFERRSFSIVCTHTNQIQRGINAEIQICREVKIQILDISERLNSKLSALMIGNGSFKDKQVFLEVHEQTEKCKSPKKFAKALHCVRSQCETEILDSRNTE